MYKFFRYIYFNCYATQVTEEMKEWYSEMKSLVNYDLFCFLKGKLYQKYKKMNKL